MKKNLRILTAVLLMEFAQVGIAGQAPDLDESSDIPITQITSYLRFSGSTAGLRSYAKQRGVQQLPRHRQRQVAPG